MIIKIIPENKEEKARIRESEHSGVTDFFVCGFKKDGDEDTIDFHEWSGKYPKLIGPLFYYAHFLINEQNIKNNAIKSAEAFTPPRQPKQPFVKRGQPQDSEVKKLDIQNMVAPEVNEGDKKENQDNQENQENVLKFAPSDNPQENPTVHDVKPIMEQNEPIKNEELPVENMVDDESKGAED